jgi:hypothetical protein
VISGNQRQECELPPQDWLSAEPTVQGRPEVGISYLHRLYCLLLCFLASGTCATAQEPALLPPSQSVAPAIVTADSGTKSSGTGKSWSKWYRLAVGKAPSGYTVHKTDFWLTGDRTCGVAAECREVLNSDQQVIWESRLQGDLEHGSARIVTLEAHIRVTYGPR